MVQLNSTSSSQVSPLRVHSELDWGEGGGLDFR